MKRLAVLLAAAALVAITLFALRLGQRSAPLVSPAAERGAGEPVAADAAAAAEPQEPPAPPEPPAISAPAAIAEPVVDTAADTTVVSEPPSSAPRPAARIAARRPAPADDPVGCVVYGSVVDADGAPLSGGEALVVVWNHAGERWTARVRGGSYALPGMQPGAWTLACSARGFRDAEVALEVPAGAELVRHDLALTPAVVLPVRLTTPDGRPLLAALHEARPPAFPGYRFDVLATSEPPGPDAGAAPALGDFRYSSHDPNPLPEEFLGTLTLHGDPPVHATLVRGETILATRIVEPGAEEVLFELDPAALLRKLAGFRLRIVAAETGEPLLHAVVTEMTKTYAMRRGSSNADGIVRVDEHEPASFTLSIVKEGFAMKHLEVDLAEGDMLDLGDVALHPESRIAGRIVDQHGAPVEAELEVGAIGADGVPAMMDQFVWRSDRSGAFTITLLEPGDYVLRSRAGRGAFVHEPVVATDHRQVSTRAGSVEGIELVARPLGRVVLRDERAEERELRVELLDGRGLPRVARRLYDRRQEAVAVPQGTYRLRVTGPGGEVLVDRDVAVGPEPLDVAIPAE